MVKDFKNLLKLALIDTAKLVIDNMVIKSPILLCFIEGFSGICIFTLSIVNCKNKNFKSYPGNLINVIT